MIATTTRDFAVTHAEAYHSLTNADQRAGWLESELVALLTSLDQAIEYNDSRHFFHYAAMMARAYDVPTPALQRAVGGCDGD